MFQGNQQQYGSRADKHNQPHTLAYQYRLRSVAARTFGHIDRKYQPTGRATQFSHRRPSERTSALFKQDFPSARPRSLYKRRCFAGQTHDVTSINLCLRLHAKDRTLGFCNLRYRSSN